MAYKFDFTRNKITSYLRSLDYIDGKAYLTLNVVDSNKVIVDQYMNLYSRDSTIPTRLIMDPEDPFDPNVIRFMSLLGHHDYFSGFPSFHDDTAIFLTASEAHIGHTDGYTYRSLVPMIQLFDMETK
jgi:hypothetical protein